MADEDKVTFEPYLWIFENCTQRVIKNCIKETVLDYIRKDYPDKAENFRNSKGELSFTINQSFTNFVLFIINEIAEKLKTNINSNEPFEIDDEDMEGNAKLSMFLEKRLSTLPEKSIIKYIDNYDKQYANNIDIHPGTYGKLIDFFNTNVNDGKEKTLFKGLDISVFNTVLTSFIKLLVNNILIRIKLGKDVRHTSIIEQIVISECEKHHDNITKRIPLYMAFDTQYKDLKKELKS